MLSQHLNKEIPRAEVCNSSPGFLKKFQAAVELIKEGLPLTIVDGKVGLSSGGKENWSNG